jgi:putative membrane protein
MYSKLSIAVGATIIALHLGPLAAANADDQHFIKESMEGNLGEVKAGGMAQEHGASQGVKDFGKMLAKDHALANDKAKQVATNLGVSPPQEPGAKQKAMCAELQKLSGDKFDHMFIKDMVKDHEEDIAKYEKEAKGSGPAASYAQQILPDLRKHLQTAQNLQQQEHSGGSSDAAGH